MSQYHQQGTWRGSGSRGASSYGAAGRAHSANRNTSRYGHSYRDNRNNIVNISNDRTLNHFTSNDQGEENESFFYIIKLHPRSFETRVLFYF